MLGYYSHMKSTFLLSIYFNFFRVSVEPRHQSEYEPQQHDMSLPNQLIYHIYAPKCIVPCVYDRNVELVHYYHPQP